MARARRRDIEAFSLSFLDCICCGFGAIILLVDGMPTMEAATTDKDFVGPNERLNIFRRAVRELPGGVPINIMLFPMEGDFDAPISFWSLALTSNGSFLTVSRDWP